MTKVEGHARLHVIIEDEKIIKCELEAIEGARFFEGLLLGKKFDEAPEITSRICGICSSAHTIATVQAIEKALGIRPSKHTLLLREALIMGETLRSHATHLYFMALPDYLGLESVLQLKEKKPKYVDFAFELITIGNKIVEAVGGREIHPFPAGFENVKINTKRLQEVKEMLKAKRDKIKKGLKIFLKLKYPKLIRKTDYLCLKKKDDYAFIGGLLHSKSGTIKTTDYKKHITEELREYSTSKFALKDGQSFMVGAMARINNNYEQLSKHAKEFLTIKPPFDNPFYNNVAQAAEILHIVDRLIEMLNKIRPVKKKKPIPKTGHAVAAVEAPRGTLFHEYKLDRDGIITYANIITPTVQNLARMEGDIQLLLQKIMHKNKDEIKLEIEKLIRAYDPCFSCSTHFLELDWKEYS